MKPNIVLAISSLLTILLGTLHLADDINRGMSAGGLPNLAVVAVGAVWLYATFILVGRRSGYIIILVGSLLMMVIPVLHLR